MSIIESPLGPIDEIPPLNFHEFCFEESRLREIEDDHVVHIDGITGEQRTYADFMERVRDGATALAADPAVGGLGIKPRSTPAEIVGILSPNCLDYIALFHSCLVLTVPCALIPSHATVSEIVYFLQKCDASRLFVHPSLLHQALTAAEEAGFPAERLYLLEGRSADRLDYGTIIESVRTNKVPRHPIEEADVDTLAYLVFSSGTSGKPKAVQATHGNLNFTLLQFITLVLERYQIRPRAAEDKPVILCYRAFCHVYALHYFLLRTFIVPTTCVILPEWDINRVLDLVPQHKVSFLPLVPFQIQEILNHPKAATTDLSSVDVIGSGSAYLHPDTAKKFMHLVSQEKTENGQLAIDDGYALSESTITNIARLDTVNDSLKATPPAGVLLSGQEARLVREDGTDADVNEPGELWLRGGNIMPGYYKDEEATKATITEDGWLRTGDVLRIDGDGVFYFVDRLKDTFKVHGGQVSPAELEETILKHPDNLVGDVAVAGVLSPKLSTAYNTPRAWIVLNATGQALGEEEVVRRLQAWTEERLSHYKWIHGGIVPVESIPRNGMGKVLRRVLKAEYEKAAQAAQLPEVPPRMNGMQFNAH